MPHDQDQIDPPSSDTPQSPLPEYLILLALIAGSVTAGINAFPF